ncbi:MAG: hypothetical protein ACD_63C00169G0002 [uncultured bacterium]|nr:MAG: hypothetical protein ACD_63C00169G0002 [uncultured bacterium]
MKNSFKNKFVVIFLCFSLSLSGFFPIFHARAIWSNVGVDFVIEQLKSFISKNLYGIIMDVLKQRAVEFIRKKIFEKVGDKGGIVLNYGKYLYGTSDNAVGRYFNAFLKNCTNIDPNVSLSLRLDAIERKTYDWCPVKVSVDNVDLGEINLAGEHGWDSYMELLSGKNNAYEQFYTLSGQLEEVRAKALEVQKLKATSSGTKPKTQGESGNEQESSAAEGSDPSKSPAEGESENVKISSIQFSSLLNAAVDTTVGFSNNLESFYSFVVVTALNTAINEILEEYE